MRILTILAISIAVLSSCGTQKTLAEKCAEQFPAKVIRDTVTEIHWEVKNFPVPELDTMYVDTTVCPPSADTVMIEKVRKVTIPARTIKARTPVKTKVVTVEKVDSALIQAYKELQIKYRQAITDLEVLEARYKESKKARSPWLPWAILLALVILAVVLAVKKK